MLSVIRNNDTYLGKFYQKLIKKGKKPKVAMIACARKFIIYLNGILKVEMLINKELIENK